MKKMNNDRYISTYSIIYNEKENISSNKINAFFSLYFIFEKSIAVEPLQTIMIYNFIYIHTLFIFIHYLYSYNHYLLF